ncbi:MAG: hypothetical protein PHF87_01255 [Desulfotomaculaceae bacterium]|nr:hypothetical protein [Desulfotomaculaceae bacterium]
MKIPPGKPWDKILDAVLVRMVVVVALLVLAAQVFLAGDPQGQDVVPAMSRDYMTPQQAVAGRDLNKPVVTFKLKEFTSLPRARLLVNGEAAGVFSDRYVTVFVAEGDTLHIDGTRYERPFEIEVLDVSREVAEPQPGFSTKVKGSLGHIGVVRLSR